MKIKLIFCQDLDGNIGKDNKLLFNIPEDMELFKKKTSTHVVVMGRKTWDSLPNKFKPLPNRLNVVLSRNTELVLRNACVVNNIYEIPIKCFYDDRFLGKDIWIIGGSEIYETYMSRASEIHQTLVYEHAVGDSKAPYIDPKQWKAVYKSHIKTYGTLSYQFITYRKIPSWQPLLNLLRAPLVKLLKLLK